MAMTAAHKRYREKNPAHKRAEDEKRLDLIISAEAMAALTAKCKAAGITRRQLLEAMALADWHYHTGVMVMPDITPVLSGEPEKEVENHILMIIVEGVASPIPNRIVHELFAGDYSEAAKQIRKLAKRQKEPEMIEKLRLLTNRIDGSKPKKKTTQEKE
jgi:hypothetical protein